MTVVYVLVRFIACNHCVVNVPGWTGAGSLPSVRELSRLSLNDSTFVRDDETDGEYLDSLSALSGTPGQPDPVLDMRQTISSEGGPGLVRDIGPRLHSEDTLVLDFGSYSMKTGRARDEFPARIDECLDPSIGLPAAHTAVDSANMRARAALVRESELGFSATVDWDGVERLWTSVLLADGMNINPGKHDFVVTEPPDANVNGKIEMASRLLEGLEIQALWCAHPRV